MSHTIEYRHLAVRLNRLLALQYMRSLDPTIVPTPYDVMKHEQPAMLVLVETGSNNTIGFDGKPARSWDLQITDDPMDVVIEASRDAEKELLRVRGRSITPERYIGMYRRLLANAVDAGGLPVPAMTFALDRKFVVAEAGYEHFPRRVQEHLFSNYFRRCGYLRESEAIRPDGTRGITLILSIGDADAGLWAAAISWLLDVAGAPLQGRPMFNQCDRMESGFQSWCDHLHQSAQLLAAA